MGGECERDEEFSSTLAALTRGPMGIFSPTIDIDEISQLYSDCDGA